MRKQLEAYEAKKREIKELRAEANRERDRVRWMGENLASERAERAWARYEAAADQLEAETEMLFAMIQKLEDADERTVLLLRYIKGESRAAVAQRMHYSERQIDRLVRMAIRNLEKEK